MQFNRAGLMVLATLLMAGMTSIASAGCCGWGAPAPVVYGWAGCGGCRVPSAAVVFTEPVAPAPIVVSVPPVGCCNLFRAAWPSPLYVANLGPAFTGPGLTVPYGVYVPGPAYAPAINYPYISGYGYQTYRYRPSFGRDFFHP